MKHAVIIALLGSSMGSQLPQNSPKIVSGQTDINMQLVEYTNYPHYELTEQKPLPEQEVVVDNYLYQSNRILHMIPISSHNQNDEDVVDDKIVVRKKYFRNKPLNDKYKFKNLQRKYTKPCIPSHR